MSTLNLFHLRYFVHLAHTQHYTQAARELSISQPSLSHAIARLEDELGVPLFERSGRNIVLTCFGQEFLDCAETTLSTLEQGIQSLQRNARSEGLIRLGLLQTLGIDYVPRLAREFLRANPEKSIRFTFSTGVAQNLAEDLAARKFDLIFSSQPPAQFEFSAVPVEQQDLVLIVPRDHPLANRHAVGLRETLPYPQVFFSPATGLRHVVDELFRQIDGTPQIACETQAEQVVAGLVAQGFGIAVVPYTDMLLRLDIKILQISCPARERIFYLIHNEKAFLPPAAQSFRQFVLDHSAL